MLALTEEQREEMRSRGYVVLPSFFQVRQPLPINPSHSRASATPPRRWLLAALPSAAQPVAKCALAAHSRPAPAAQGEELASIVSRLEESIAAKERGEDAVHELFFELSDHPRILPYVVDLLGWNIQLRDALFSPVPPRADVPKCAQLQALPRATVAQPLPPGRPGAPVQEENSGARAAQPATSPAPAPDTAARVAAGRTRCARRGTSTRRRSSPASPVTHAPAYRPSFSLGCVVAHVGAAVPQRTA